MCGITGVIAFNELGLSFHERVSRSVESLKKRGPDGDACFYHKNVGFGHSRLAVIDTSEAGSQPFTDASGRFTIIFNGEIYNYKEFRKTLIQKGYTFKSESDTEVLLHLYMEEGVDCLKKINGCFAFAIYDKSTESVFIARDRMGINPLLVYQDNDKLIFASEMKAVVAYGITKDLDTTSLLEYLQLNYIPGPASIFNNVRKLLPGNYLFVKNNIVEEKQYYQIPFYSESPSILTYEQAGDKLLELVEEAVRTRLVADVPVGAFLSGGIDSSVIVALASRFTSQLNTFSIGYKDEPYFDETQYAELVAKKYKTNHTVFRLSNDDLFDNLFHVLDYIDEPFADSSALAVHILSMHTRKKVTVALSGDGADEMFGGYNKHLAHYKARYAGTGGNLVKAGAPIWNMIPQSRNGKLGNKVRQLNRFANGLKMNEQDRYWRWCSFNDENSARKLLKAELSTAIFEERRSKILANIGKTKDLNDILHTDMHLVLQNDMLTKVDLMSMANSLEVRTPFLDHSVVDFVFSLPSAFKINNNMKKRLLQDTFRPLLPEAIYNRTKHGFEVPLLKWLRNELHSLINNDLLNDNFVIEQNLFNPDEIKKLKKKLLSTNPGDIHAKIWGLLVFQYWWKTQMTT